MHVRTVSPSLPVTLPLRRSRTWPDFSLPTHVWQIPSRHPKGSSRPASSPATRIGVPPSHSVFSPLFANVIVPPSPSSPPPIFG